MMGGGKNCCRPAGTNLGQYNQNCLLLEKITEK